MDHFHAIVDKPDT